MPLVDFYWPHRLSAKRFDKFHAKGWFRSGNTLYRTQIVCLEEDFHSPINVRMPLEEHEFPKRIKKLRKKNQKHFDVSIRPLRFIDSARGHLYQQHKHRFKGFICETLEEYLTGAYRGDLFQSYEVAVRHGKKLVAWSCFDLGDEAASSIVGLYDPSYSKFSLGKFTMVCEIDYLKENGFKFYYPGYILEGCEDFNYKMELGSMQYRQENGYWKKWDAKDSFPEFPSIRLKQKTESLIRALRADGFEPRAFIYPVYPFGYLEGHEFLLNCPMFVKINGEKKDFPMQVAFYDLETDEFKIVQSFVMPNRMIEGFEMPAISDSAKVWKHMLTKTSELWTGQSIEELIAFLHKPVPQPKIIPGKMR